MLIAGTELENVTITVRTEKRHLIRCRFRKTHVGHQNDEERWVRANRLDAHRLLDRNWPYNSNKEPQRTCFMHTYKTELIFELIHKFIPKNFTCCYLIHRFCNPMIRSATKLQSHRVSIPAYLKYVEILIMTMTWIYQKNEFPWDLRPKWWGGRVLYWRHTWSQQ